MIRKKELTITINDTVEKMGKAIEDGNFGIVLPGRTEKTIAVEDYFVPNCKLNINSSDSWNLVM